MIAIVKKPPCERNNICALTTTESRANVWYTSNKIHLSPWWLRLAVFLLLLINCIVLFLVLVLLFSTLCPFSFAIILMGKGELIALL